MLLRIAELKHLGCFESLDHPDNPDLRFRRHTLIYAANGTGKSTLADILRAASSGDAEICSRRHRLASKASSQTPSVTLAFEDNTQSFRNGVWGRCPHPIEVFDSRYIDDNLFVGRAPQKSHRARMLELALGADEVRWKRTLDRQQQQSLDLNRSLRGVESTLTAYAREHRMTLDEFIQLPTCDDHDAAVHAAEQRRSAAARPGRPGRHDRYQPVEPPARRDPEKLRVFLSRDIGRSTSGTSPEAGAAVRDHISKHLRDDEEFVRRGLSLMSGDACPFCARDAAGSALIADYRAVFDKAHREFVAQIDAADKALRDQRELVHAAAEIVTRNKTIAKLWDDAKIVPSPEGLGAALGRHPERALDCILDTLSDHRGPSPDPASIARAVAAAADWNGFVDAAADYNANVAQANIALEGWVARSAEDAPEDAESDLRHAHAARSRHRAEVAEQVRERDTLLQARWKLTAEKKAAALSGQAATARRLGDFANHLDQHLQPFGTGFRVKDLGTERSGGKPALRFSIAIGDDTVEIKDSRSEEAFSDLLSDGDRSALALALFVTDLLDQTDLEEQIVVFDDPTTNMDPHRTRATADLVRRVAVRARQTIVLSHDPQFLAALTNEPAGLDDASVAKIRLECRGDGDRRQRFIPAIRP